jgi:radical SAM superfamily enzyme YgiQ (UPF0313 family)
MNKRVLLLHPPYTTDCNRGYYCSATTKSAYLFPPLDLLFVSGTLRGAGCRVDLVDCVADRIDGRRAIERIEAIGPDCIVALCGIVSWDEDRAFFRALRARYGAPIVVSGDVFLDAPERIMKEEEWIDGILFDFTNGDIVHYLEGEDRAIVDMAFRRGETVHARREGESGATFKLAVPMHELFLGKRYRHPFTRSRPLTSVLTSFGCPYHCYFCVADKIPFRHRRAEDVIEELDHVKGLGIPEILFFDFTFGVPREDRKRLCETMIERRYGFHWSCYSRVDVVDEEMLALFKASGCHTIMFGVESGDDGILKDYRKGFDTGRVRRVFSLCRKMGIDTVATFILGGMFDTLESCKRTIRFARELGCDYASFNVAVPRPRTSFREEAVAGKLVRDTDLDFDHSGNVCAHGTNSLSADEIRHLRRHAIRSFYLRPGYAVRRLARVRSRHQLFELTSNGIELIKNYLSFG